MNSLYRLIVLGALLIPSMLNATNLAPIDNTGVQVQPTQQNGVTYLSGGIGEDEARAIGQAQGYNLHMTFAIGPENKYVPDVDVTVQKTSGQTLLTLSDAGPLVYVQLPPGKYTVVAIRNGEERRDTAEVGSGAARKLVFHWNNSE
ncbi:carboxypeptidase regulatory-like domain-containing protein [Pseudomonas sp. SWRI92]|uniref:Carboxypeptidase regulatory-like domain-containing protein n=1 Tax=Pseudomonas marvdashtae TaxID=2745500 RepID=A0A923JT79_9PSED|nr:MULTISPECIES: carboxypeptidase regulatory-like domain-containing protein [Pseudomonas]MBC3375587.1 carboxypeptidase regulatory-like domain-containing protein [Pseudomonas sp. SWRI92]MBV4554487.1 carboxypeptidase regulatory-like domain-containing protein [Pseudomonas marvdashtae]